MDLGLDKKIIIVTGGSKGIGSGIVSILAEEGAIPIIIGRNQNNILKSISNYRKKDMRLDMLLLNCLIPNNAIWL